MHLTFWLFQIALVTRACFSVDFRRFHRKLLHIQIGREISNFEQNKKKSISTIFLNKFSEHKINENNFHFINLNLFVKFNLWLNFQLVVSIRLDQTRITILFSFLHIAELGYPRRAEIDFRCFQFHLVIEDSRLSHEM